MGRERRVKAPLGTFKILSGFGLATVGLVAPPGTKAPSVTYGGCVCTRCNAIGCPNPHNAARAGLCDDCHEGRHAGYVDLDDVD